MTKFKMLLPTILMLIFEVVIGVLLLIDGEKFTQVVFIIFGVFVLICGLITLISALMTGRNGGSLSMPRLIFAVVLLAVGAFFAAASGSVMSIMSAVTVVLGIIVAFNGTLKLVDYLSFRRRSDVKWFGIISAILTIIIGIVIAFNPFGATAAMWTILGIMILVAAGLNIISLIAFGIALREMPAQNTIEAEFKDIDK